MFMRSTSWMWVGIAALAILAGVGHAADAPKYKTENVVLLVIDGPRYTETWGEPTKKYIPCMSTKMAPEGVFFSEFYNMGPTLTNPGHTALTSGFYQMIDNAGKELPAKPTILQRFLKHTGGHPTTAWLITSKDKLEVLANTTDPEWNGKYLVATDCGENGNPSKYRDDTITMASIKRILPRDHPRLVVINFREPDRSGHAKDWEGFLKGIQDTDKYACEIWELIQSDPYYKDKTALFISNDHGRHIDGRADGFISHGDECSGCRRISLLAMGPDFKKGAVITERRQQIDVAVTMAHLLGIEIPESKGQVLTELFAEPKADK